MANKRGPRNPKSAELVDNKDSGDNRDDDEPELEQEPEGSTTSVRSSSSLTELSGDDAAAANNEKNAGTGEKADGVEGGSKRKQKQKQGSARGDKGAQRGILTDI